MVLASQPSIQNKKASLASQSNLTGLFGFSVQVILWGKQFKKTFPASQSKLKDPLSFSALATHNGERNCNKIFLASQPNLKSLLGFSAQLKRSSRLLSPTSTLGNTIWKTFLASQPKLEDLLGFSTLLIALWGIKCNKICLASQTKLEVEQSCVQGPERWRAG